MEKLSLKQFCTGLLLMAGFSLVAQSPPATWQEHWFEHQQNVSLVYNDSDLNVYYDAEMDPSITWINTYIGDAWRYTKQLYGDMSGGTGDGVLWAIFHQDKYGGGHPGYYFDAGHDYRNVIDLGQNGSWTLPTGWALDASIHEIAHIVESVTNSSNGSPAFPIWGDSKWAVIYQYDVYVELGWTSEATRWYNSQVNDPWFAEWFYPIWNNYGNGEVLSDFFIVLSQHFPKNGNTYSRNMNWGEFVHFWSEAAGEDLSSLAENAFDWTSARQAEFAQAQLDFPLSYHAAANVVDITDQPGSISAQYSDSPSGEGIGNLVDNNSSTKYLTFHNAGWVQYSASDSYIVTSYALTSANDAPARDPLIWTLQGSNNGSSWTTIDSRSGQDFPSRYQRREFSFNNSIPYTSYRLQMTNNSGNILQLAELEIYGEEYVEIVDITDQGGSVSAQYADSPANEGIGNLVDNSANTKYLTFHSSAWVQFASSNSYIATSYALTSANDAATRDPLNWTLQGSNDGSSWATIDSRNGEDFANRFQRRVFTFSNNTAYSQYRLQMTNNSGTVLQLAELEIYGEQVGTGGDGDWDNFPYPQINFVNNAPSHNGSTIFNSAIPDPVVDMQEQLLDVAKQIYYNDADNILTFNRLNFYLEDYDGVASKWGAPPEINIQVSVRHIENVYNNNGGDLNAVRQEILGILSHEGTHAYQYEPKNAGGYSGGTDFYGFIEGLADYVRINTRGFSPPRYPSTGGNWTSGYTTSGFFIDWLADNKDPDFAKKFNHTARTYGTWSWDAACQEILGESVQSLWNQYQASLSGARTLGGVAGSTLECSAMLSRPELPEDFKLVITPNPTKDQLQVLGLQSPAEISIMGLDGREVLRRSVDSTESIDVSPLTNGIYLIKIHPNNGEVVFKKLLKK